MVEIRTKSKAFFGLFGQGLSVSKCHLKSEKIVQNWGTLAGTNSELLNSKGTILSKA